MRSAVCRCSLLKRQLERALSHYQSGCSNAAPLQAFARGLSSVITPDPPEWEVAYQTWKMERDDPYRQRMPDELIEMRNLGGVGGEEEEEDDDEDEEDEDEQGGGRSGRKRRYEPAPRRTAADESHNVRSLERALDQKLIMLVRSAGKGAHWRFPQTAHAGGEETMRAAAQRALDASLAPHAELQTWFVGRSPCLHHPAPPDAPASGAKALAKGGGGGAVGDEGSARTLFFHRVQLIRGVPALKAGSGLAEFAWVTKAELGDRLDDPTLVAQLQKAL